MDYKSFASGYLVKDGKVLLVHHNKFNKWVPPGGHIEEGETPDQTIVREFLEETGLKVKVIPVFKNNFTGDDNCTPLPLPFQMGIYREGFSSPRIGYVFLIELVGDASDLKHQELELHGADWFTLEQVKNLPAFEQAIIESEYALKNYPKNS